ncbi:MAG: hypothetical protein JNM85_05875 [Chthonomonas sp.]|nr:hypothetical protein [Chthonomonas sp.]
MYLADAVESGRVWLAGRTETAPFAGIAIVRALDDASAERFLQSDPAVAEGVFLGSILPFRLALHGTDFDPTQE